MFLITDFPEELAERKNATLTNGILRGVERECLRVKQDGQFSLDPHPKALGSALTHPFITTDFSEALLEFITPPTHQIGDLFAHLDGIHRHVAAKLGDELLWTTSMPCALPENENDIPVAQYGHSHNGQMKSIYRVGLGNRYGRSMQTVAGLHYNFSLPNAFWAHFHSKENSLLSLEAFKDQRYFGLIRNFRRHFWLLILLFGASPAMCRSFVGSRQHNLDTHPKSQALYRPYATSLRMGDLGYQSSAQESLFICYNHKHSYIKTLADAILEPHPLYQQQSLKDKNGEYTQLNQGLLQIENEFYSAIRPKRSAKPGETALTALHNRGVEYIEVRCLDINPYDPLGISEEQVAFLDTFLLYCALADSPEADDAEFSAILKNQKKIVNEGRKPGLSLEHPEHGQLSVHTWAKDLMSAMRPVAELLNSTYEDDRFTQALTAQEACIDDLSLTPSATLLSQLDAEHGGYSALTLALTRKNNERLMMSPLSADATARYDDIALESVAQQIAIESNTEGRFDSFLHNYYTQYERLRE